MDRLSELIRDTPLREEIEAVYDPSRERIQEQHHQTELVLRGIDERKQSV